MQGSVVAPISGDEWDNGPVNTAKQDVEEVVTYRDEKNSDDSLKVAESLTEIDETSDIWDEVSELDSIFNEIVEPSMAITEGMK